MAVLVRSGASFESSASQALFQTRLRYLMTTAPDNQQTYDVTADGQRFLLNVPAEDVGPAIRVVLNWPATLRR